jgi:hypothetical protein
MDSKLTIPQMFENVDYLLKNVDPTEDWVYISFDAQYGFVSSGSVGCIRNNALLLPGIADCGSSLQYEYFQVLP